jgi:hypothetical protein
MSIKSSPVSAVNSVPTLPWYRRLLHAIGIGAAAVVRAIYKIVAPAVRSAAIQFVNDPANQAAAIAAARAAMARGLYGDAAWVAARDALVAQLGASASSIADNWLDTLLQTAYFSVRNALDQE